MAGSPGLAVPESFSHYYVLRLIGQGAMGAVYEGRDRRDDSRVAIKFLYPHLASDPAFRDRFEREAHVAALLRSPYTVHLIDYGIAGDWLYLVMEFIDGATLADYIQQGPLPVEAALGYAVEVARALEEASARNVVHRDIKPENILVDSRGRARVADFGIARQSSRAGQTAVGGFVGSPAFAAPEQAEGQADHRSDIYSLGVTLFAMLTGQPPFSGSSFEVVTQHRRAAIPTAPLAGVPLPAVNVIRRCMEKHPADRYQSAGELIAAIERAQKAIAEMDPAEASLTAIPPDPAHAVFAPAGTPFTSVGETRTPARPFDVTSAPPPTAVLRSHSTLPPLAAAARAINSDGRRSGWTTFELTVSGTGQTARPVRLEVFEATQGALISLPEVATIPAAGVASIPLRIKPRRRRWLGNDIPRPVSIAASGGGDEPPGTTTVIFMDRSRGWGFLGPIAGFAAAVVMIPAAVMAMAALTGGDGGGVAPPAAGATEEDPSTSPTASRSPAGTATEEATPGDASPSPTPRSEQSSPQEATPTPTSTASATPTATLAPGTTPPPTPTATRTATPSPTPRPPTPTPTRTATPSPTPVPPTPTPTPPAAFLNGTGGWTYVATVSQNTCSFGPVEGQTYPWGVSWREAGTPDGKVDVGERVELTDQEFGLTITRNLTYPNFSVSFRLFRLSYQMSLTHYVTFTGPNSVVVNEIVENYDTEGCQIVWH